MALTTSSSNTQSCTVTTEHSLVTDTTAGIYVCMWNLTNAVAGDVFECYVKTKVLTGDTAEEIYHAVYANNLGGIPIIASPPIVSMFSLTMLVKQAAGTSRNVPWSLIRIGT